MSSSTSRWVLVLVLAVASTSASACGTGSRGSGAGTPTSSTDLEQGADFTASGVAIDRLTRRLRRFMNGFAACGQGSYMTATSACLDGAAPAASAAGVAVERLNDLIPKTRLACAAALHALGATALGVGLGTTLVMRVWQPGNAFGVRAVLARLSASIGLYFRALQRASSQCEYTF